MSNDEMEKLKQKELKNNPTGAFADAVNRSMIGDSGAFTSGGCLKNILTFVIFIIVILILSQCFNG